jgi:hypothetical protein
VQELISLKKAFLVVTALICILVTSGFTYKNPDLSEKENVERTVHNFIKSLNTHNYELFLRSVVSSNKNDKKFFDSEKQTSEIEYTIIESRKISNTRYDVLLQKNMNGTQFPIIPYSVVFQENTWKFDNSSVVIYPKRTVANHLATANFLANNQNIVSENENFYVVKKDPPKSQITLFGNLTYDFGVNSTDIYSSGTLDINCFPGANDESDDEYNFVIAELFDEDPMDSVWVDSEFLDAFNFDYTSFSCTGYHSVNVYNYNYPWLPGKYTVFY